IPKIRERAAQGEVQKQGVETKRASVQAYAAENFPIFGEATIRAKEPEADYENVAAITGPGGSTPDIRSVSAYEHGGGNGHEILSVSVAMVVPPPKTDSLPTPRWPKIELVVNQIQQHPDPAVQPVPNQPQPQPAPPKPKPAAPQPKQEAPRQ